MMGALSRRLSRITSSGRVLPEVEGLRALARLERLLDARSGPPRRDGGVTPSRVGTPEEGATSGRGEREVLR